MYLEYGFNDYVSKPVRPDKLEEVLQTYLPQELIVMENVDGQTI